MCIEVIPLVYMVYMSIFTDKSAYYVDVVYLRYLINLRRIREYNWETSCLIYLYSKLDEACLWKTRQMTTSNTLFTVVYLHLYCY